MTENAAALQREIDMLRQELKVAREAAQITAEFVVRQFEQTESMLHRFRTANAERQAVLDAATQLTIIATDLDGTIRIFSKGAETLLGYKPAEMIGKYNILSLHLPEDLERYGKEVSRIPGSSLHDMKVFDQFVKQKQSQAQDWVYVCKDGTHMPMRLSITRLFNAEGRVAGYLFAGMDMSLQKQMESALIDAKEAAESANASKGDFLARMSHEIRTPMNGIIGMASLLQKTVLDDTQHNYVDKLLVSANTLLRLLNDILDFSKIDAGKLQLENVTFNLEDVLGNIASVVGMQAEKKGLEFVFRIEEGVPKRLVGDSLRLGQILLNLTGNAVKFTERGEVVISVAVENMVEGECTLRFAVRDSGIGLRPDQIDRLFSAFSQADNSITRKYGGTGLGLAICQQLTELMGGRIWVESEVGRGAVFTFTVVMGLPSQRESIVAAVPEQLHGLRALVVDDNEVARDVLSSMLRSMNMQVDTAADGAAAISYLEKKAKQGQPYDVMLLDWIMPEMDGIETARRIKANAAIARVPAMLMVTANGREDAYLEAEKVGLDAFLLKPVYASVMYETLLNIIGVASVSPTHGKRAVESDVDLSSIQGARVLLVDDNSINQEVGAAFLHSGGLDVTLAGNGRECLDTLNKDDFDLVLMDIQMPEMDGLEATRRIRNNPRFKNLPIIAMTAHAMGGDREKSLAAGMNDHITKPIDQKILFQTLKRWITEGRNPVRGHEAVSAESIELDLPEMQGIDVNGALKAVNNNTRLLLKMFEEFRRNFSIVPTRLRGLSEDGDWQEIGRVAHTVKGVAGYIGAAVLMGKAAALEDAVRREQRQEQAERLVQFIDALDLVLSSLGRLQSLSSPYSDADTQKKEEDPEQLAEGEIDTLLEQLIGQLQRGEAEADEQFAAVRSELRGRGVDDRLDQLAELIDDIEFDHAAEVAMRLRKDLQQKV